MCTKLHEHKTACAQNCMCTKLHVHKTACAQNCRCTKLQQAQVCGRKVNNVFFCLYKESITCTNYKLSHSTKKPVTIMLTYPWKCTVLHCNHLGNTWKPLVLMTQHFDYCPSTSEGDNQSVRLSPTLHPPSSPTVHQLS